MCRQLAQAEVIVVRNSGTHAIITRQSAYSEEQTMLHLCLCLVYIHALDLPIYMGNALNATQQVIHTSTNSQACSNAAPLALTKSSHVDTPVRCAQLCAWPGAPAVAHTAFPKSPLEQNYSIKPLHLTSEVEKEYQSVVSNTTDWSWKDCDGLHVLAGHLAIGSPQFSGTGLPPEISDGIAFLGKKYMEMPSSSHCTTRPS